MQQCPVGYLCQIPCGRMFSRWDISCSCECKHAKAIAKFSFTLTHEGNKGKKIIFLSTLLLFWLLMCINNHFSFILGDTFG